MHDIAGIAKAAKAWDLFQAEDPKRHAEKLSQSSVILAVAVANWKFYPLRHLWTWLDGIPFAVSGRSLNAHSLTPILQDMGLARVTQGSAFFESVLQRYVAACEALGKQPGKVKEPDPRTGRVFWITPGPFPAP